MKGEHSAADVTRTLCRLLVVAGVLSTAVFGLVCVASPVLADESPSTPSPEHNESASIEYGGDALVYEDESVYVWRRESLDVSISVRQDETGNEVCLYRSARATAPTRLDCQQIETPNAPTLTFEDAGYDVSGPRVYRFEVRVLDSSDRVRWQTQSRRIIRMTNWSAIEDDRLGEYVEETGFANGSRTDTNGTATTTSSGVTRPETTTTEKASPVTDTRTRTRSQRSQASQQLSTPDSVDTNITIPSFSQTPKTLFSTPVLLLGGSGVLALLGLLYVQRRRSTDDPGFAPDSEFIRPSSQQPGDRSDPERIVQLLAQNNGQLKQSDIVEATDLSKAKVSRLLSRMADHGYIHKQQHGRQNIIILRRRD